MEAEGAARGAQGDGGRRTSSGNLKVNVAMGAVLLEQGDLSGAETTLNQALRVEPSNPEGNYYIALVHAARQEWTAAIESMRAALDRVPGRASYHYELGRIYKDAKKVPEAIDEWKVAVKLDPKYADAWAAIGETEQEGQRCDEAIPAYESALAADPSRTHLLVAVGDCEAQTNHLIRGALQSCRSNDPLNRALFLDIETLLPDQVLAFVDRLPMAHSVEVRPPFLDHRLVQFVADLPGSVKIKAGRVKHILKEAVRDLLPRELFDRPKEGFIMPVNEWLIGNLKGYVQATLAPERLARHGLFQADAIRQMLEAHYSGSANRGNQIWNLLMLQLGRRI